MLLSGDPCGGSAPGSTVGGRWRGVARRSPRSSIIGAGWRIAATSRGAQTFAPPHRVAWLGRFWPLFIEAAAIFALARVRGVRAVS